MSLNAEELAAIREVQATQCANWGRLDDELEELSTYATALYTGAITPAAIPAGKIAFLFAHVAAELNMRRGLRMLCELGELN